ncbi:jg7536 [Pararge aegeria aegeria]|uniref:Jg7536 protein n=1 Tax=Pararge aegeria aegeria TaxID=348720 RepID=A0A8S4QVF4_9NEOP|nr:jg7536 [Pararge aegeria aegeria]
MIVTLEIIQMSKIVHVVTATSNVTMVTAFLHPKNVTYRMTVKMVLMNEIALMVWLFKIYSPLNFIVYFM